MARSLALLGSTGSIGTQALEVVESGTDHDLIGLAASGKNVEIFIEQARRFGHAELALFDSNAAHHVEELLGRKVHAGLAGVARIAGMGADVVLNAITGSVGLAPTLAALKAGSTLALANKESLVAGGPLVKANAKPGQIVPVDSEHSAIAQCLRAGSQSEVSKLILTASGGPFRGKALAELAKVSVKDALAHPTWVMGPVVTVNSASLVNKGLEVIEAHMLFDIAYEQIEVVIHPQSIVHSMVEFQDGSTLAQLSPPNMQLPIALALSWPSRSTFSTPTIDWKNSTEWSFSQVDHELFPSLRLAYRAGGIGGVAPAIFNAANEEAVSAFLTGHLNFVHIPQVLEGVLDHFSGTSSGISMEQVSVVDDILRAESAARAFALLQIEKLIRKGDGR